MLYAVAILASVALVLVNAFFVAAEFAIVKIRPSRLEQLAARGHRRARVALGIARRLDAYLSANQLGITLASLALGWIGEPAFAGLLKPLFASFGMWSVPTAHAVAVIPSFAAITFLHTVLGELAPKSLAIQRTEPVALWTATPLCVFYLVMFPVIWTLNSYVTVKLGELAQPGQSILRGGFRLTALGMRDGRVQRLRGEPPPETHPRRKLVEDREQLH